MTYRGIHVEWLNSVSLTSIMNANIGSGGSGCVSRVRQSQYGTLDMSRYSIMWCYMLSTLSNDKIENKLKALSYWLNCIEGNNKGVTQKWQSLFGWLSARKTHSSAWAMELRLSCIKPSISSHGWSNNQEMWVVFVAMWERNIDQHDW